jgi:hypothetical protein
LTAFNDLGYQLSQESASYDRSCSSCFPNLLFSKHGPKQHRFKDFKNPEIHLLIKLIHLYYNNYRSGVSNLIYDIYKL